ncbi:MAG: c-type cytochrome, partial [Magnetospiraceae bacterium]
HYYPAFPYTSYQYMRLEDMIDLKAFLDTLAPVTEAAPDHQVGFPFTLRRGLGLWKLLYLDGKPLPADPNANAQVARGQYLVQGPGHCSACHTPRDQFGGLLEARFLAGNPGVTLDGKKEGAAPNITPHASGIGSWSAGEIAYSLESGFDPSYDTFGGEMVALQENMAKLPAADREAIAAYLKSIPALPSETTNQP